MLPLLSSISGEVHECCEEEACASRPGDVDNNSNNGNNHIISKTIGAAHDQRQTGGERGAPGSGNIAHTENQSSQNAQSAIIQIDNVFGTGNRMIMDHKIGILSRI